jgi:hypothetical protein
MTKRSRKYFKQKKIKPISFFDEIFPYINEYQRSYLKLQQYLFKQGIKMQGACSYVNNR